MSNKKKQYGAQFKAKVALEAIPPVNNQLMINKIEREPKEKSSRD